MLSSSSIRRMINLSAVCVLVSLTEVFTACSMTLNTTLAWHPCLKISISAQRKEFLICTKIPFMLSCAWYKHDKWSNNEFFCECSVLVSWGTWMWWDYSQIWWMSGYKWKRVDDLPNRWLFLSARVFISLRKQRRYLQWEK